MSASTSPTRWPWACSARARLTAMVVLPTPPLPLATAMIGALELGTWAACASLTLMSVPTADCLQTLLDSSLSGAGSHLRSITHGDAHPAGLLDAGRLR